MTYREQRDFKDKNLWITSDEKESRKTHTNGHAAGLSHDRHKQRFKKRNEIGRAQKT